MTAIVSIAIGASCTALVSGTVQLTAIATYDDASTADVTSSAAWSSSASAIAAVNASGLVSVANIGTVTITAIKGGVTARLALACAAPGFSFAIHLATAAPGDPTVPIDNHAFVDGDAKIITPLDIGRGDGFHAARAGHVENLAFGDYDVLFDADDVMVNGCIYVYANVAGAQPARGFDFIVTPADPIITEVPFALELETDPISGDATGRDLSGRVRIMFDDDLGYSVVPTVQIAERGYNMYAVVLTPRQRARSGRAFVRVDEVPGDTRALTADYPMAPGLGYFYAPFVVVGAPPAVIPPARVQALPGTVDHVAAALGRLAQQFRSKPKTVALVTFRANRWQAIENVFWTLFSKRSIADRTGPLLDQVGAIVGQARAGLADANYRPYLYARIATDRSSGTVADLIKIARLILQSTAGKVIVQPQRIMTTVVQFFDMVIADPIANLLLDFLQAAAVAGERIIVQTSYVADARTFCCAIAAHPAAGLTAGATTINVPSTAKFPTSGSLDIDLGLAVAETVTYTGVTATSFLGVSPLAHNHAALCAVQLHRTGRGLGRGSSASAITAGDTSIVVDNTVGFPTSGTLLVDGALFPYTAVPSSTHFTLAAPAVASHPASVAYQYDLGGKLASARDRHYPVGA